MNVLTIFEQRIGAIFESGAPGERMPFSFKRLAKRAVREMEDETFVIDGVDTAPALYTILVSSKDDYLMRPMYVLITNEVSQLIEAQAKKRGYTFVGKPLVRFMVDPALRGGKFSVFAENIDPRTLARLRDEENAYLGVTPPREIHVEHGFVPEPVPVHDEEPAPVAAEVAYVGDNASDNVVAVEEFASDLEAFDAEPALDDAEEFDAMDAEPSQDFDAEPAEAFDEAPSLVEDFEAPADPSLSEPVVPAWLEPEHTPAPAVDRVVNPLYADDSVDFGKTYEPSCTLVDLDTGEEHHITSDYALIGRERVAGGIVVRDPNASRRHAELVFAHGSWRVRDLRSTNGTLVNNVDVPEAVLHDGDVLTIGLTNLAFRVS